MCTRDLNMYRTPRWISPMYAESKTILEFSCCSCAAEHCRGAVFLYTTGMTARLSQSSVHPITGYKFSWIWSLWCVFFREILHHMLPMYWPSNNMTSHQEKLNPKFFLVHLFYSLIFFLIFSPLVSISYQYSKFQVLIFSIGFFHFCPLKVLEKTWCRFWQGPAKQSRSSYYQFCIYHNAECGVLFGRILWVCWYFFCPKVALWAFWKGWRSQIVLDFCRLWPVHLSIVEGFVQLS
jgi:hypothetical protein